MAHLEKMFVSEGLPDRPYHTLDNRVTYKSEVATAEMKETKVIQQPKREFHPITTEIHVTELRPIKLDSLPQRGASESHYPSEGNSNQMWERRLQSESGVQDLKTQTEQGYSMEYQHESHRTQQNHTSSTMTRQSESSHINQPELKPNIIRTITSRNGSYSGSSPGSSPSGTLSPPGYRRDQGTAEFRRRDVSPDYQLVKPEVTLIDGKCQCCPYGFHVDVDFMDFCDTVSNQSYLKQLKRLQREKRKLRKSMEVYLQDQEDTEGRSTLANPMENHTQYRETTTNRILDEIDSSVDQTLTSIETMMTQSNQSQRYLDTGTATVQRGETRKFNTFPKKVGKQVAQDLQNYNETFTATFNDTNRADSRDSLSSVSTSASERVYPYNQGFATTETTTTRTTNMTSQQLAETMATLLPAEDGAASPQSNTANISKQSLHAIREAMAVSLQRMKDLEEQVKAIPVLQVRISVLKEEKRLLGLQMQAQKHVNTESRGVGDATINSPITPISPRFDYGVKTPPPTLPKPKVRMAAVGDHSVHEPYFLQPDLEDSTHVFERDTIIIDRAQRQQAVLNAEASKPMTRTVGVGEGNVLDDSLHIHEKELRTVIIGQGISAGKRNVGINCKVPTRDVGVAYNFDSFEKPATRSVGITTEITPVTTNVSFRSEEFTSALRTALAKSVRSVAIQVDKRSQYANVGIQSELSVWNTRSIAVGDCSIDVEVRNPVARRSVSIDAYPDRMNRAMNTDYGWRLDAMTNTVAQFTDNISTQTENKRLYNAFTNTEKIGSYHAGCQTDVKVFLATDQLRNTGSCTEKRLTYNTGMNTIHKPLFERGVNTVNMTHTRNWGMNTEEPNTRNIGVSDDRIDSFVCDLEEEEDYRFEEEGVETKTLYYTSMADQTDTKKAKGFEIKREYAGDNYATESSDSSSVTMKSGQVVKRQGSASTSEEETEENIEILEEKVWRCDAEGKFTVTTVITRRIEGGPRDGSVTKETKTESGGVEILGGDAERIQEECRRGRRSGGSVGDIWQAAASASSMSSSSSSSSSFDVKRGEGDTAIERVLGNQEYTKYMQEVAQQDAEKQRSATSKSDRSSIDFKSELDSLRGMSDSGMSSSSDHSTTYTTVIHGGSGSPQMQVTEQRFSSIDGSPQTETFTRSFDSGLSTGSASSSSELITQTLSSSSMLSEGESPSGTLKSIMKKSTSDPGGNQKRGITFADTVVGGFELGRDMKEACEVLSTYLEDSTKIQTKQLNSSIAVIQQEWFKVSSSKLADAHQVEDYLSCFNEISKRLLENIVNMQDSNGNTAIHYAVSNCNFEIVNLMLDTGTCDLNKMNKAGYTAVIMATLASIQTQRQEEVVQRLFSMGNVNIKASKDGQTAMMFAVRQGRGEMVKMLLDTGADLNIQDNEGSTALMCASEHGHTEIIKMLLNTPGCDASISDNDGSTALSIAMEAGHKDAGVLLYAHVNFGRGQSPAPSKKTRKTSGSSVDSPTLK